MFEPQWDPESDEGSVVHWSQQVALISECKMCLASFLLSVSLLVSLVMKCTIIFAEMSQSVHILIANQVCLGTGSLAFDICGVHLTGPEKFFNDTRRSSHNRLNHSSLLNHLFPNLFSRWYWSFRFKNPHALSKGLWGILDVCLQSRGQHSLRHHLFLDQLQTQNLIKNLTSKRHSLENLCS